VKKRKVGKRGRKRRKIKIEICKRKDEKGRRKGGKEGKLKVEFQERERRMRRREGYERDLRQ
jgi:hypothetical protein